MIKIEFWIEDKLINESWEDINQTIDLKMSQAKHKFMNEIAKRKIGVRGSTINEEKR